MLKTEHAYSMDEDTKLVDINLSVRTINCMRNNDIHTIRDLLKWPEAELLRTPNFGKKSLRELQEMLDGMGLRLRKQNDSAEMPRRSSQNMPPTQVSPS